jgi:hypothetical protein
VTKQTSDRIGSPRATSSKRISPWRFATSADRPPVLRNTATLCREMKLSNSQCQTELSKAELIPGPSQLHSATANNETSKNPEYFPNYLKIDQIFRVSLELVNL